MLMCILYIINILSFCFMMNQVYAQVFSFQVVCIFMELRIA